jgi:hypothetical protein
LSIRLVNNLNENILHDLAYLSSPALTECLRKYFTVDNFLTCGVPSEHLQYYMKGIYDVIHLLEKDGD